MFTRSIVRLTLALIIVGASLLLVTSITTAASADARPNVDLIVNPGESIQAAIDAANDGDTIIVNAGDYTESLTLSKPVSLTGVNSDTTIIHAMAGQRVLTVTGATISNSVVISGLMFTGGDVSSVSLLQSSEATRLRSLANTSPRLHVSNAALSPYFFSLLAASPVTHSIPSVPWTKPPLTLSNTLALFPFSGAAPIAIGACPEHCGGGILISDVAQPRLQNLIIITNTAGESGGGVYAANALMLINVSFFNNTASVNGGGAYAQSAVAITGGQFEDNHTIEIPYPVVTRGSGLYTGGTLALSGTQFINNYRLGEISSSSEGGGVYVGGAADLTDAYFERNSAIHFGGGLYAANQLTLTNTVFTNNSTFLGYGSGIFVVGPASISGGRFELNNTTALLANGAISITGTDFISNSGWRGGGLLAAGNAVISHANFLGNYGAYGGGLEALGTLNINGSTFNDNSSAYGGGGIYAHATTIVSDSHFEHNFGGTFFNGGGLYSLSTLFITNTNFVENTAAYGGGLATDGPARLARVKVNGNIARLNGAGLYAIQSFDLADTQVTRNIAQGYGGGVFHTGSGPARIVNSLFAQNVAGSSGAALYLESMGNVEILHDVIADTTINPRPAVQIAAGTVGITDTLIVSHCTGISQTGGLAQEDYNLYYRNMADWQGSVASGSHSVHGDPAFVDPTHDDYHLSQSSTAIDAGLATDIAVDIDGEPRGTSPDIGYDEVSPIAISVLNATSNAPTALGFATTLTAHVNSGTDVTYQWGFGDGETGIGKVVTHTYATLGTYTAVVTAANSINGPFSTTLIVTVVNDIPISGLQAINDGPTQIGDITTLSTSIMAGTRVIYSWNFGDGEVGSGSLVTHTYPDLGSYTAIVTATNSVSLLTSTTTVMVLTDVPIKNLQINNTSPTLLGSTTALTAQIDAGTTVTYTWSLGDGSIAQGSLVTHTYLLTTTYLVVVTATNSVSQITQTAGVTIYAPSTRSVGTTCASTIRACLAEAYPGDTVFVPAGLYTESVTLSKPISLIGEDRTTTIVQAVPGQRVLTVRGSAISSTVVISGFTLMDGGQPGGIECPIGQGGGLLVSDNAQPRIENLIIKDNRSVDDGGGFYADTGSPLTLRNVVLDNNVARWGRGGGIFAADTLTVINGQFISNTAFSGGGGAYLLQAALLSDTQFISNSSIGAGGGLVAAKALTMSDSTVSGNQSTGVWMSGGGLYSEGDLAVINSRFHHNSADTAGGLTTRGPTVRFIEADFDANSGGGALVGDYTLTSTIHISGGHFSDHTSGAALTANSPVEISGTLFISNTSGGARIYSSPAVITNSRFENNHCTQCDAGGLYFYGSRNDGNVPLTLSSAVFIGNSPGGAYIYQSSMITVIGSRFEHNSTPTYGGALWAYDSPLTMIDTEVISNTAIDGPGGVTAHPTTILIDSRFEDNVSSGSYGGGLWTGELFLTNTNFISNSAAAGGGALTWKAHLNGGRFERNMAQVYGGGLATSELYISGTDFVSNTTQLGGGGGALTYGATVLLNGKFENNRAYGSQNDIYGGNGGGLAVAAGPLVITGTQFIRNSTGGIGGGLFYTEATDSRIINALFADNTADIEGAAVAVNSMGQHEMLYSTVAGSSFIPKPAIAILSGTFGITNTIIANHAIGISNTGGLVTEDYNLFYNNLTNTVGVITGAHSLVGDPHFVDPADNDYHLAFGSAAIDHGIDAGVYTDLDGNLRPQGAGFDIGTYESVIYHTFLPVLRR